MASMNVSVRELKDGLSGFLRQVAKGKSIVVTDHGRPVAELVPLDMSRLTPRQRLEELTAAGDVSRPNGRAFATVKPCRIRGRAVSTTLLEDRG
jgi:prevent-host-death family protein